MKVVGLQKLSTVDYPGNLCATIFLGGCNMNCSFCHNRNTALQESEQKIDIDDVLDFLEKRKGLLDAVCISGGEPTLHGEVFDLIQEIKEMGYKVKLDTNGSNPQLVSTLIENKLIDYIAMDIKAPWNRYNEVCGGTVDVEKIKETTAIITKSGIKYEFRTTFIPTMSVDDIKTIASDPYIRGAQKYVLQQFRNPDGVDVFGLGMPHKKDYVMETINEVKDMFNSCDIRGI